jgi:hypothetical protein
MKNKPKTKKMMGIAITAIPMMPCPKSSSGPKNAVELPAARSGTDELEPVAVAAVDSSPVEEVAADTGISVGAASELHPTSRKI